MDISFLCNYVNPVVLGICLIAGYCLKEAFAWFQNRYIPLAAACLGAVINVLMNMDQITAAVILGGMISGLASTGLYEMLRNLLKPEKK